MSARRSVDWRDSGIIIDEDSHLFSSFDTICGVFDSSVFSLTSHRVDPKQSQETKQTDCSNNEMSHNRMSATNHAPNFNAALQKFNLDQEEDGDTILHLAVVGFAPDKVADLIRICDVNAINNMMQTPLHIAVLANRSVMINLLISSGAMADKRDRKGNTALHLACQSGCTDLVNSILNVDFISFQDSTLNKAKYMELTNFDGLTCLHLAALRDAREVIRTLVCNHNANINMRDTKSGETIIHKAIRKSNVGLAKFILELSSDVCNQMDYSGNRPLDIIKLFMDSRLDREQYNNLLKIKGLLSKQAGGLYSQSPSKEGAKSDSDTSTYSSSDYSDSDYEL